MKKFAALAGLGAIALAGAANADFTGVELVEVGEILPGTTTYRIFAVSDNPTDRLLAVNGDFNGFGEAGVLRFMSTADLVQDAGPFNGTAFGDRPNLFDANGADSWVSIGINAAGNGSDTAFSPGFLGGDGSGSVINGSMFEQLNNGGYFDQNPSTVEGDGAIIAQFTLPTGAEWSYQGVLSFATDAGGPFGTTFSVVVPAPGAVALLGLAGLAGTRRRRA